MPLGGLFITLGLFKPTEAMLFTLFDTGWALLFLTPIPPAVYTTPSFKSSSFDVTILGALFLAEKPGFVGCFMTGLGPLILVALVEVLK
jgi:hypothetical protein